MKLTTILLLAAVLQVSAKGNAQKTITYSAKSVSLEKLFSVIKKQTSYVFFYREEDIKDATAVSVDFKNTPLEVVLEQVLTGQKLKYNIQGKAIFITKENDSVEKKEEEEEEKLPPLIDVKGRVVNEKGEPVIATVTVKGTKKATSTNENGEFVLTGVEDDATLVITGVGIETFVVRVNGRTDLANVTGRIKITEQEEVIINAGYYQVEDRRRTGNIAKVTAKEIEKQPVTSPLIALQGRVAGLEITPRNGVPGIAPGIRIRGENSLRHDGGFPLYIIDGLPIESRPLQSGSTSLAFFGFDPLSSIDPANIESIEVLKDADATAIYGSRGANGVIIITTKTGQKSRKTNFDFNIYRGFGKVYSKIELLNTEQYVTMRKEAYANDGLTPSGAAARDLLEWDTTRYTDWQEVLMGNSAKITDLQTSISGGNSTTNFRLGGDLHAETMVFPGDFGFQRVSGYLNVNHISTNNKFKASMSANYGWMQNKLFDDLNLVNNAITLPPNSPELYNDNGELNWQIRPNGSSGWINPISLMRKTHEEKTSSYLANVGLGYEVISGLLLKTTLGFSELAGDELLKVPFSSMDPTSIWSGTTAENIFGLNKRKSWIIEPQLSYNRKFKKSNINIIIGSTFQESSSEYRSILARGYTSDFLLGSLQAATQTYITADNYSQYRYTAGFGRLGYELKEKYLLNLTGRRDGSSRFGPGKRFGNFGAVGAGWIFSKEPSLKNGLSFLSYGKLRASYGTTGNDQIGDYKYFDTYSITFLNYQNTISFYPTALFNPDYAWEITKKVEAAIDLSFFNHRLSFELSWYRNRSSSQLVEYQLPVTTGFQSILSNFPATVENRGWEFLLRSENIKGPDLRWSSSFNLTFPRNKLIEFPDIDESPYATQYKVGEPLALQRLYTWKGINPATGLNEFLDVNGDGNIDDADKTFMEYGVRKYYGGLINSISYRAIEFSFLLQFSSHSLGTYLPGTAPGFRGNQPVEVMERWQKVGDISGTQKFTRNFSNLQSYDNLLQSDHAIADGSFIRLKTLSVSWDLPLEFLQRVEMEACKIFLQGQNVFTVTKYKGLDPETGNSLPPLQMITAGIQLKF